MSSFKITPLDISGSLSRGLTAGKQLFSGLPGTSSPEDEARRLALEKGRLDVQRSRQQLQQAGQPSRADQEKLALSTARITVPLLDKAIAQMERDPIAGVRSIEFAQKGIANAATQGLVDPRLAEAASGINPAEVTLEQMRELRDQQGIVLQGLQGPQKPVKETPLTGATEKKQAAILNIRATREALEEVRRRDPEGVAKARIQSLREGALTRAAGAPKNVITVDNRAGVEKGTRKKLEVDAEQLQQSSGALEDILSIPDDLFGAKAGLTGAAGEMFDFLGVPADDTIAFAEKRADKMGDAAEEALFFLHNFAGAAMTEPEIKRIAKVFKDPERSGPTVFKASIRGMLRRTNRRLGIKRDILREGISVAPTGQGDPAPGPAVAPQQAQAPVQTGPRGAAAGTPQPLPPGTMTTKGGAPRPQRTDPNTGEVREWDGQTWVPVNG